MVEEVRRATSNAIYTGHNWSVRGIGRIFMNFVYMVEVRVLVVIFEKKQFFRFVDYSHTESIIY